jgi:hypothetical protein
MLYHKLELCAMLGTSPNLPAGRAGRLKTFCRAKAGKRTEKHNQN